MDDDPLLDPGLTRRLDSTARHEMESAERQAEALRQRQRSLSDVAWEAVQAGTVLMVRIGDLEYSGAPLYARGDLLSLATTYGVIEFNLAAIDVLRPDPARGSAGRSVPVEAESFIARLALLQLARESIEVVTRGGAWKGDGRLHAVARDHIVLVSVRGPSYVRMEAIACVVRRINT